jgi:hypothetical protein
MTRCLSPATLLAIGALLTSCNDPASADSHTVSFSIVSGNHQTGPAGTELPQPLVVKVQDGRGQPLKASVHFRVASGGGRMNAGSAVSDANGVAQDYWTLGPTSGVQTVDVVAVDPATGAEKVYGSFSATATGT